MELQQRQKGYFKGELGGKKIRIVSKWNSNGT